MERPDPVIINKYEIISFQVEESESLLKAEIASIFYQIFSQRFEMVYILMKEYYTSLGKQMEIGEKKSSIDL
jgi:hypothetical protein